MVEEERGSRCQVDKLPSLWAQPRLATEGGDEFVFERQCLASRHRSAVNCAESAQLDPGHRGVQTVAGVGSRLLHLSCPSDPDSDTGASSVWRASRNFASLQRKRRTSGGSPWGSARSANMTIR